MKPTDYKIIIDLTPLTSPYSSKLEATKYQDGSWHFLQVYKTTPKFDNANTSNLSELLKLLTKKLKSSRNKLDNLEDNLKFLKSKIES